MSILFTFSDWASKGVRFGAALYRCGSLSQVKFCNRYKIVSKQLGPKQSANYRWRDFINNHKAPKARNMTARGKCDAKRRASPLVTKIKICLALKGRDTTTFYFGPSGHGLALEYLTRGDARRFASRLPLAFIFRACGAPRIPPTEGRIIRTLLGARNPAHRRGRIVQILSINQTMLFLNPANGSWRIVQVRTVYRTIGDL